VDETRIKDAGSKVRCSQCKHVFTIFKPQPETGLGPVPEPAPVAPAPPEETAPEEKADEEPPGGAADDFGLDDGPGAADDFGLEEDVAEADPFDFGDFDKDLGLSETPGEADDDDFGLGFDEETGTEPDDFSSSPDVGLGEDDEPGLGSLEDELGLGDIDGETGFPGLDDEDDAAGFPGLDDEDEEDFGSPSEPLATFPDEEDDEGVSPEPLTTAYHFPSADEDLEEAAERQIEEEEDYDDVISGEVEPGRRGKSHVFLWLMVILLFLTAAGGAVYYFVPQTLEPLLAKIGLSPETAKANEDPAGNAKIKPYEAKHFFRVNEKAGEILIITGLAQNNYDTPRGYIQLKGVLQDANNQALAQRMVYAGNKLSDADLSSLPVNEILDRLLIRGGQNGVNMTVPPGKSVEFMIVFDNIPRNLKGYTVEVVGSKPANK
jgi:hypothetical protein